MNFNRHISDLFGMSLVLEKKTLTPQLFNKKGHLYTRWFNTIFSFVKTDAGAGAVANGSKTK
jgi:hypothetical protein